LSSNRLTVQLAGMRKPQAFTVYPRHDAAAEIVVQSDRAIGRFDPQTGVGVLNWRGSHAKYFHHLAPEMGAEAFTFPADFVASAIASEASAGRELVAGVVMVAI
jgi:hypothetical protein